ncbi:hypothetical protein [Clostridium sp. JNZ J1-5]
MGDKPYIDYYYWEYLIKNHENLWNHSFKKMPLTRRSVFINTIIMDCEGCNSNQWVYYPNIKAALGFIEYVFLTTAFFKALMSEYDGKFILPVGTMDQLIYMSNNLNTGRNKEDMPEMNRQAGKLHSLWKLGDIECLELLKEFSNEFNRYWAYREDVLFSVNVFKTPMEIGEHIMKVCSEEALEIIENEVTLTLDEWKYIFENVYDNQFIRRRFMNILNNLTWLV